MDWFSSRNFAVDLEAASSMELALDLECLQGLLRETEAFSYRQIVAISEYFRCLASMEDARGNEALVKAGLAHYIVDNEKRKMKKYIDEVGSEGALEEAMEYWEVIVEWGDKGLPYGAFLTKKARERNKKNVWGVSDGWGPSRLKRG